MTDAEDDAEFDRWCSLTPAQQDAELNSEIRKYNEWWATLSRQERYHVQRECLLDSARRWRRNIQAIDIPVLRKMHKRCQMLMLDARLQYYKACLSGYHP